MNHTYRIIFSEELGAWIAVSEVTKSKGKKSRKGVLAHVVTTAIVVGGLAIADPPALAATGSTSYYWTNTTLTGGTTNDNQALGGYATVVGWGIMQSLLELTLLAQATTQMHKVPAVLRWAHLQTPLLPQVMVSPLVTLLLYLVTVL